MMRKILVVFITFYSFAIVMADDQRFEKANEHYTNGDFQAAISIYEEVLSTGMESAALYYNLGNAYYKNGMLAQAILNYERGKLLSPQDKDIAYNLELAGSQTTDKIEQVGSFFLSKWVNSLINKGDSDFWAYVTIASFVVFIALLFLFFFSQTSAFKRAGFYLGVVLLFFTVLSFSFSYNQKQKLVVRSHAIVFSPSVTVKSSPDTSGTEIFVLHEGTKVKIISELGEWCEIELIDGNVGWINASTVEVI